MSMKTLLAVGRSVVGAVKRDFRPAGIGSLPHFSRTETGPFSTALIQGDAVKIGAGNIAKAGLMPAKPNASVGTPAWSKPSRSWLGWLFGGNRRRETGPLVQGELLLQNVRPIRNDLRNDDVALVERRQTKVLYETPPATSTRDDQGHAWNRLRGRRLEKLVVKGD